MRIRNILSTLAVLSLGLLSSCLSVQNQAQAPATPKMFTLEKAPDRDFVVLNISDPQLNNNEWRAGAAQRRILVRTLEELIGRVKPNLITVSGDLAWAGQDKSYEALASYLDSFGIPWAPVWGNHDNQNGLDYSIQLGNRMKKHPFCLLDAGDPKLGSCNYVIAIREQDKVVAGIIMMDTHDREPWPTPKDPKNKCWAKLYPEQLDWYASQIDSLNQLGCKNTAIVLHIPIFAYREASDAAFGKAVNSKKLTWEQSLKPEIWNPGYESSKGYRHEGIGSYPKDDGALQVILDKGSTTHIICGHDHVNNFIIPYNGVKLVYSLKAGAGCYWEPQSNGGTVLTIGKDGIKDVRHEFVDVTDLLPLLPKKK